MTEQAPEVACRNGHKFDPSSVVDALVESLKGTEFEGGEMLMGTLTCPKCGVRVHWQPPSSQK